VRESLVFEVADGELDDGVLAVLGLDDRESASLTCSTAARRASDCLCRRLV